MAYDFAFKPFEEMTPDDYSAVGFKSGLEIHQQLLTRSKLFCRCPAGRYSSRYDAEILRHMRPTLSELGEYDGTALMEFKTRKEIIYRINRETVCTYEMDDTPPFMIDEEALDIALGIGMLYRCVMIDELHIARKQYLDGSIPTGFQRTTIVGVDGWVPYKDRKIKIIQLGLEEDACREVSDVGHRRTYLTDRLGMPLIETVTAPDMRTPDEVADVAQILRRIVRSTGQVRTGIGAAREDVNVSVTGGTRIEIKGVPRIPRIPLLTYNEATRQWNLLRLREELAGRGITPATFAASFEEVTRHLRRSAYGPLQTALAAGMVAYAVRLEGFRGLLRWQTQTHTFFSQEISDRVRVVACLTTLPNIAHSDSPSESLASADWQMVKKALGAKEGDAVVVVWGPAQDAKLGAQEIILRAKEATEGVPSETRQALPDGTNGFERILPGPNRMYPDTDLPPKQVAPERLEAIRNGLPTDILEREARYRGLGVPGEIVPKLAASRFAPLFEKAAADGRPSVGTAAAVLVHTPIKIRKRGLPADKLTEESMASILRALAEGSLFREGVTPLVEKALSAGGDIVSELTSWSAPSSQPESVADDALNIAASLRGKRFEDAGRRKRRAMGLLMSAWRGRISGAEAARAIDEALEKVPA